MTLLNVKWTEMMGFVTLLNVKWTDVMGFVTLLSGQKLWVLLHCYM